MWMREEAVGL
jgi:hypothetical protein